MESKGEDIKGSDEETKKMMREIFNEVIMHKDITPEALKRVTIKVATQREQKITVQYVRCLYCTKCFRHFYTTCFYNKLDRRQPRDQRGGSSLTSNPASSSNMQVARTTKAESVVSRCGSRRSN